MQQLSLDLFGNSELIAIALTSIVAIFLLYFLFKKISFPKNNHLEEKQSSYTSSERVYKPWSKKDVFILTSLTIFYAIVSLWQLGSSSMPETTWQPSSDSEFIILKVDDSTTHFDSVYAIYGEGDNNNNLDSYQIGFHQIQITGSNDHETWEHIGYLENGSIYQYTVLSGDWNYKYIGIVSSNKNDTLTEIGFKAYGEDRLLSVSVDTDSYSDSLYPADLVIDEQDKIALYPTFFDQGYFDEIYHPRNAWEIANGQYMYSSVHPLLGTSIIAVGIKLFGCNPFGWRIMGALFGVMLVPMFYLILKKLFDRTYLSAIGTSLFVSDFMHLTTSRIGTLEPFSVFFILLMFYFMISYYYTNMFTTPLKKQYTLLALSGIAMGLAISTKWTGCYGAIGLAVLFFTSFIQRTIEYKKAKKFIKTVSPQEKEFVEASNIVKIYPRTAFDTILWCILWFVFVPAVIYCISYIPTHVWRTPWSVMNVVNQAQGMFKYHANLEATHPFQSVWWQWIFDIQPIWYYNGTGAGGIAHTISCFSNPILCIVGTISIILTTLFTIRDKSKSGWVIVVGYFSALLPWVLVTRCIFSYHYYPATPFYILAVVYCAKKLLETNYRYKKIITGFTIICFLVFILFLPVTAGFGTTYEFIHNVLNWFPSWYFG